MIESGIRDLQKLVNTEIYPYNITFRDILRYSEKHLLILFEFPHC